MAQRQPWNGSVSSYDHLKNYREKGNKRHEKRFSLHECIVEEYEKWAGTLVMMKAMVHSWKHAQTVHGMPQMVNPY